MDDFQLGCAVEVVNAHLHAVKLGVVLSVISAGANRVVAVLVLASVPLVGPVRPASVARDVHGILPLVLVYPDLNKLHAPVVLSDPVDQNDAAE